MTTDSILELLKRINQQMGITIVVITHEMEVIRKICRRVAIIDGGVIAEPVSYTHLAFPRLCREKTALIRQTL